MLDRQQYCSECGDPTGRAGNFHDHLYIQLPDEDYERGPLCDTCAQNLSTEFGVDIIYKG